MAYTCMAKSMISARRDFGGIIIETQMRSRSRAEPAPYAYCFSRIRFFFKLEAVTFTPTSIRSLPKGATTANPAQQDMNHRKGKLHSTKYVGECCLKYQLWRSVLQWSRDLGPGPGHWNSLKGFLIFLPAENQHSFLFWRGSCCSSKGYCGRLLPVTTKSLPQSAQFLTTRTLRSNPHASDGYLRTLTPMGEADSRASCAGPRPRPTLAEPPSTAGPTQPLCQLKKNWWATGSRFVGYGFLDNFAELSYVCIGVKFLALPTQWNLGLMMSLISLIV